MFRVKELNYQNQRLVDYNKTENESARQSQTLQYLHSFDRHMQLLQAVELSNKRKINDINVSVIDVHFTKC